MYQFSRWKYWLVIIVVVFGTLFALPNVFGEGPALQLSRNDRAAMDEAAQQRVLGVLEAQKVTPEVSYLEKDRLVLRFADPQQQAAARDAITKGDYGRLSGRFVERAAHAGVDAQRRPEADEPRPRSARRRALRLRGRHPGRDRAGRRAHGARCAHHAARQARAVRRRHFEQRRGARRPAQRLGPAGCDGCA